MSSLPSILSTLQHHKFLFPMVYFDPPPAPSFDIHVFFFKFIFSVFHDIIHTVYL